jgi:hypothetical protein
MLPMRNLALIRGLDFGEQVTATGVGDACAIGAQDGEPHSACRGDPAGTDDLRFAYVYGVALNACSRQ